MAERALAQAVGPRRATSAATALRDASRAFQRQRWQDAWRLLRPLAEAAPGAAEVREMCGLSLYRLGRWSAAAAHLEAWRALTGSVENHPVLADCYRARGRYKLVGELWEELRQASPSAALVVEGRIVAAGALADRGDVAGAIALLERGPLNPRRVPEPHHLRLWYALADLHERAGNTSQARELFSRVVSADPELADAPSRLASLK